MSVVQESVRLGQRPTFTEREPFERGFATQFSKISLHLSELESDRLRLKRNRLIRSVLFCVILVAALTVVALFYPQGWLFAVIVVGAVFLGMKVLAGPGEAYGQRLRDLVMPPVCAFLGGATYDRKAGNFDLPRFQKHRLVGSYGRSHSRVEDHFVGAYRGSRYEVAEANLNIKRGKQTSQVFRGLLMAVDLPAPVGSDVLLTRDLGKFLNKLVGLVREERVVFEDPAFEKIYEVYSPDPAVARSLLTPMVRDSLVKLAGSRPEGAPYACFAGDKFLMAWPSRTNMFEAGGLSKSVARIEDDLHGLLRDVTIAQRVIDLLQIEGGGKST